MWALSDLEPKGADSRPSRAGSGEEQYRYLLYVASLKWYWENITAWAQQGVTVLSVRRRG